MNCFLSVRFRINRFPRFLFFALAILLTLAFAGCHVTSEVEGQEQDVGAVSDASVSESLDKQAEDTVDSLSLDQKIDQLFIVTPEALTGVDKVTAAGTSTQSALANHPVGGIVYFAQNLENPDQARQMLQNTQQYAEDETGLPIFLAVDEEGGTVARVAKNSSFGVQDVGDMREIGSTGDPARAREAASTIGSYLTDLGFNVDFAPVADIASDADSSMYQRSFGNDPQLVSQMVDSAINGFNEAGILCAVKHFPGIGGADGDSHRQTITTDETVDQMESDTLVPFSKAIDDDVPFVMVGHLSVLSANPDGTPASLSREMISGVLRDQMGYDGIIITDSLSMKAVTNRCSASESGVAALQAGADMLLMPEDYQACRQGIVDAINNGSLSESRIDESVTRIVKAKLRLREA